MSYNVAEYHWMAHYCLHDGEKIADLSETVSCGRPTNEGNQIFELEGHVRLRILMKIDGGRYLVSVRTSAQIGRGRYVVSVRMSAQIGRGRYLVSVRMRAQIGRGRYPVSVRMSAQIGRGRYLVSNLVCVCVHKLAGEGILLVCV